MKIDELARLMGKRREEVEHILKNNDFIELDLNEVEWQSIIIKTIKDKYYYEVCINKIIIKK